MADDSGRSEALGPQASPVRLVPTAVPGSEAARSSATPVAENSTLSGRAARAAAPDAPVRSPLDWATSYLEAGYVPVPFAPRKKRPLLGDWLRYRPTPEDLRRDFGGSTNVGVLLGEPSGGLVDVDIDCPEGLVLAPHFLPATAVFGRAGSRSSHWIYQCRPPAPQTARFADPQAEGSDRGAIVELRSTGCATLFPGSTHPSGENISWETDSEPELIDPECLRTCAACLAACSLVARHWPARGRRHDASLALAGLLLRHGWTDEDATSLVTRAAEAAGDEEWQARAADVRTTRQRISAARPATGEPSLARLLGSPVAGALHRWLDLGRYAPPPTWPPLGELPEPLPRVERLDPALIPEPLRGWLADVAERAQVPLEFGAVPALIGVATVVGRQIGIMPKRRDHWLVIPNLWGAIVAPPGTLKTPVVKEGLEPLFNLALRAQDRFREERAAAEPELQELDARAAATSDSMRRAVKDDRALDACRRELAELAQRRRQLEPRERRYVTSDATIEKLIALLASNPRGLLWHRDELAGLLRSLERPGREGDREALLECWSGDGAYTTDRIGRGTVHARALCLSVFGTIQPGKLVRFIGELNRDGLGDGLIQRFQLMAYPDLPRHWKNVDRPPDRAERTRARRAVEALDNLDLECLPIERDGEIPGVRFTDDGQQEFDAWREELEGRLRSSELDEVLASHLGKFRSLMPTLALLDWLLGVADGSPAGTGVPAESATRARRWCQFLEPHARRVYGGIIDSDHHAAHALARRIKRGDVRDGTSIRQVYRRQWSRLTNRDCVDAAIDILREAGWVRTERVETGGRRSEILRLHPELGGER